PALDVVDQPGVVAAAHRAQQPGLLAEPGDEAHVVPEPLGQVLDGDPGPVVIAGGQDHPAGGAAAQLADLGVTGDHPTLIAEHKGSPLRFSGPPPSTDGP